MLYGNLNHLRYALFSAFIFFQNIHHLCGTPLKEWLCLDKMLLKLSYSANGNQRHYAMAFGGNMENCEVGKVCDGSAGEKEGKL